MRAGLVLLVLASSALAQDTPLSQVLIPGEDWQLVTDNVLPDAGERQYFSKKDEKGRWALYRKGRHEPVAVAAESEVFGDAIVSAGGGQLVLAVPSHHYLYSFQIRQDGTLTAKEKTYVLRRDRPGRGGSAVGTLAFDTRGRLYAAMPGGVQFFDPEMRFSGQFSRPEREPVTALAFGGAKRDELFIRCGNKVWKRKLNAQGLPRGKP